MIREATFSTTYPSWQTFFEFRALRTKIYRNQIDFRSLQPLQKVCWIQIFIKNSFGQMGNQSSDAAEIKAFNIIKNIPVVSQLYRLPRAIVYASKNNKEQVRRSAEYKVQNLNPLKCIGNIARGFVALTTSYEEGIWIGKRTLLESPVGLNFSPGADLMHWAVMINHTIYQLTGQDNEGYCCYLVSTCQKQRQTFHWYATDLRPNWSNEEIKREVSRLEAMRMKYSRIAVADPNTSNCQMFVLCLLEKICGVSQGMLATQIIIFADGTWII